jgi:D-alanyl-lipoteichoic acid acyltransferase DltB (MBOAT superfamily)
MLLGGLWHGANWTFVVWDGIHGLVMLAVNRAHSSFQPAACSEEAASRDDGMLEPISKLRAGVDPL